MPIPIIKRPRRASIFKVAKLQTVAGAFPGTWIRHVGAEFDPAAIVHAPGEAPVLNVHNCRKFPRRRRPGASLDSDMDLRSTS